MAKAKKSGARCVCHKATNGRKVCIRKGKFSGVRFCKAPKRGKRR